MVYHWVVHCPHKHQGHTEDSSSGPQHSSIPTLSSDRLFLVSCMSALQGEQWAKVRELLSGRLHAWSNFLLWHKSFMWYLLLCTQPLLLHHQLKLSQKAFLLEKYDYRHFIAGNNQEHHVIQVENRFYLSFWIQIFSNDCPEWKRIMRLRIKLKNTMKDDQGQLRPRAAIAIYEVPAITQSFLGREVSTQKGN